MGEDPASSDPLNRAGLEVEASAKSGEQPKAEDTKPAKQGKEDEKKKPPPSVAFYKLFSYADPIDWFLITVGIIGAIVHGAALPIFFLFFGEVIDALGTNDLGAVAEFAAYLVYLGLIVWFGSWLEVGCWMHTGERQSARIREAYLAAILKQEIAFFDTESSSGEIVNNVSGDVLLVQDAISEKVGNFLHFFSTFIVGFIIGFSKIWELTLVILAVVPLIAACGATYAIVLTGLTSKGAAAYAEAGGVAEQAISQVRTVYSFVAEDKTLKKYMLALEETLALGIKGGLSKGLGMGGVFGVMFGAWALQFWYAAKLVAKGEANGGDALATMFSVLIGGISLGQAMPNLTAFAKGQAAAYTIFATIARKSNIDIDDEGGERPKGVTGDIQLKDVRFAYPARPDVTIFESFSLSISAGTTVAIVGSSGSGKSTVVALVERFYDPLGGVVMLDGRDLRALNLKWLRGQIGMVSQEPALFATTIKDNILYGKESPASMDEVEAAARAANAHAFIAALPEGYNTQVGERGTQLSGGQKQRIAIARAILRNPSILLLDEATSALDAESEKAVQTALDGIMGGRTTIVIAHRLSTIRNADTIAVVTKGTLVEQGTHDSLMSLNGEYSLLVKMQMQAGDAGELGGGDTASIANSAAAAVSSRRSLDLQQQSTLSEGGKSAGSHGDDGEEEKGGKGGKAKGKGSWWRLFKLTLPDWPYTVLACIGGAIAGAVNPVFGLFLTTVITAYYNPDVEAMKDEVNKWAIVFVCLGIISFLVYTLQHYNFGIVSERLTKRVRELMLGAILRNEIAWFDDERNSSGAVAARLSSDATLVKGAIGDRISVIVQNFSLILTAFVISFVLNWRMAAVLIATFPLLVVASGAQQAFMKGFGGDMKAAHESASNVAGEAVGNIRTVAALSLESKVLSLFQKQLAAPLRRSFRRGQVSGLVFGFTQFLMFSSFALGLWYGSTLIPEHGTFEEVFKVFMVLIMTSFAIAETLTLAPDLAKGGYAIDSFFAVLDRATQILPDDPTAVPVESIRGDIELKHVRFAYPSRPDVVLFEDFSLKVPAGKTVALVGPSGSGKSSVIALIERFYDPLGGRVMIDGKDIKMLQLRTLRSHVGLVNQEPALFGVSIRENILYGREGATEAEIVEAAKAANAHTFISGLPDGYDTEVGERGTQLSGGQKQRIAIARAVLKNPAILLLDEATSALDAESERVVQEALDRLMVGRTTVVIAHRLSTIRNADIIAVVQGGKIVEKGTHDALFNDPSSSYHGLVKLQQSSGVAAN